MRNSFSSQDQIARLKEREKEMKCLYTVQEIIGENLPVDEFLNKIIKHLWGGWQYPNITRAKITFEDKTYKEAGWEETEWVQSSNIIIDDAVLGKIEVYYTQFKQLVTDSQFLPEEQKLLNTIAAQIGNYIFNKRLKSTLEVLGSDKKQKAIIEGNTIPLLHVQSDLHWKWRYDFVNIIADKLNMERFGVKAFYIIGSTKNATAGPASDIDLLVHFEGNATQELELKAWLEGWSFCLSEVNFKKTGYKTDGLIDLHIVTNEDIQNKTSFASMIGAVTDAAKLIKIN
jgi:hypothetical protein